jgi:signal transduction histidine kinase/CheY-like chemotaxis protein
MALWMAAALLGGAGGRAADVAPTASPEVITRVRQFWEIMGDAKRQPYQVQLEFVVCYYDPQWSLLWALGDDGVCYIRCGEKRYPLQPGQRIRVDGLMSPADGLSLEKADIKILDDNVPLQPVPWQFQGKAEDGAKLPSQLVSMEGFVNRQAEIDKAHVLLDMTVGEWPVQARVLLQNLGTEPQCESAFVQVQGVLVPNVTPAGQLSALALWVARPEDVKVKGWLGADPRFNQAQVPIEMLPKLAADRFVRVIGTAWSQEPGHSLTIRDGTGQVAILTGQIQPVRIGRRIEAIGHPAIQGEKWQLREGLYRLLPGSQDEEGSALAAPSILRLAGQVLELGNEQAVHARPVRLFGVVTWAYPGVRFFYVNDASGGIRVVLDKNGGPVPVQGNTVEVGGVSAAGDFAPIVRAASITVAGSLSMPEAQDVTLEQALTGVEEGQWIELRGYLREVGRDGPWARLRLTTSAGEFTAYLPPSDQLATLLGSVVRLRGVCSAVANDQQELVGIRLWVPSSSSDYIQVEQAALLDPFSVPERSIASLRRFSTLQVINRRVRISGVVLLQIPGRYLYVQEGTDSLQVLSRDTAPLDPGTQVEVVGFPGREGSRLVLREAVYRRRAGGGEPPPAALDTPEAVQEDLDGHLVRVAGVLLDITNRDKEIRLLIQAGKAMFEAVMDHGDPGGGQSQWVLGSRLAVTGVYEIQFDEYRHPRAFQVQLRSSRDVQVLSRPSWWTLRSALTAMGGFALCTALGIGWVLTLRRRVRRQTEQIRAQLEKEARLEAELQHSAKLESLGVLAGGIAHDFNNLLTVIMGNLTLAKLDTADSSVMGGWLREAEHGVLRARDLTLQLLTFAKGGDPVRKAVMLSDIVQEAAEFTLHGSKVRCEFDIAADLWPAEVDKGQIGQVMQNIVLNATEAMPDGGVIHVALRNTIVEANAVPDLAAGHYLKLTVADTGQGINPAHLSRIFDPYFSTKPNGSGLGLATVYSIVKRHLGRIEVQSETGRGTTFSIWLPAAQKPPSAAPMAPEPLARQSGRVLLMDDEEAIRLATAALLQRLGIEAVVANDGAQVLREYAAARAAGRPYDLVILDLTVPGGMGGRETMEQLLRMDPQVRALVSSGYSNDPVLAHYRAHGFLGMVPKPCDIEELARVIHAALKGEAA